MFIHDALFVIFQNHNELAVKSITLNYRVKSPWLLAIFCQVKSDS